jgi:hypothetical protein
MPAQFPDEVEDFDPGELTADEVVAAEEKKRERVSDIMDEIASHDPDHQDN